MVIDCGSCAVRGAACGDCVITVVLGATGEVALDETEQDAIAVLAAAGLVPPLRLAPAATG